MSTLRNRLYRYSRNLEGLNAQGFFSILDLAGDATIDAFQLSGSEGEIIVLNEDGTTQIGGALTAGEKFTIAQIVDGEVKRSTELTFGTGNMTVTKTAYVAPVIQEWAIGYNGTSGSLNLAAFAVNQEFVVSARDLTPNNQPFPVMEGRAIIKTATPSTYAILAEIANGLVGVYDYENSGEEPFARVDILSDEAGTVGATVANYTLRNGSAVVPVSADVTGQVLVGGLIAFNDGVTSGNSWYKVVAATASQITLDRPWSGADQVLANTAIFVETLATVNAGELGLRLRGATEVTNFTVGVSEDMAAADITENVAWKLGSGAPWQVSSMEDETSVFAGATTINTQWKEDWGQPTKFVDPDSSEQFDLWFLKYRNVEQSNAAPKESTEHYGYVIIGSSDATAQGKLDTIFGT